jgi:hypothetical protein
MKTTLLAFFLPFLFAWVSASAVAVSNTESAENLRGTIERYFSSMEGYQPGDLISQSQVEELQLYLLRTQGRISATHPRLLHQVLPDEAPLIRSFYLDDGAEVLREAAKRLHGYDRLQALAHTVPGRAQISAAIGSKSPDLLVNSVKQVLSSETRSNSPEQDERQVKSEDNHIFTLEQFIEASQPPSSAGNPYPIAKSPAEQPTATDSGSTPVELEK